MFFQKNDVPLQTDGREIALGHQEVKPLKVIEMRNFEIRNMISPVERTFGGHNVCLYVMNDPDSYCSLEWLANCVAKKAKKLGYIDESVLYSSSTLKAITRNIRKYYGTNYGETFSMDDDRSGRYELLQHIYEHVQALIN